MPEEKKKKTKKNQKNYRELKSFNIIINKIVLMVHAVIYDN